MSEALNSKAPITFGTLASLISAGVVIVPLIFYFANQGTEVVSLRKDLENARLLGREQRESIARRSIEMNQQQQLEIDRLRLDLSAQATMLAEIRATLASLNTSVKRIEDRLFGNPNGR